MTLTLDHPADTVPARAAVAAPDGGDIAWTIQGSGPPLVLVHGSFSDNRSEWAAVAPLLARHFTLHAVARRGRAGSAPRGDLGLDTEGRDVAAVIRAVGVPAYVLGYSYGAQVALAATREVPNRVRGLILFEPPRTDCIPDSRLAELTAFEQAGDADGLADHFFRAQLQTHAPTLDNLRESALWADIVADASATMGDLRALRAYRFVPEGFAKLDLPVTLQVATESAHHLYATEEIMAALPHARRAVLEGEGHEAAVTAPEAYAEQVRRLCLD